MFCVLDLISISEDIGVLHFVFLVVLFNCSLLTNSLFRCFVSVCIVPDVPRSFLFVQNYIKHYSLPGLFLTTHKKYSHGELP